MGAPIRRTGEQKRAIPRHPRVIGLITSDTGAAVRDLRRFAAGASRCFSANGLTFGAAAVAAQIPGVSRRTVYRSAPVMEAREDLQRRRETPGS